MKRSTGLSLAVFVLLVVGLIVYAARPVPVPVDLAPVVRGSLEVTVNEEGKTRVRDRYTVSAPLGGRLLRIGFDPGDKVEAGKTLLAVLEPSVPHFLDDRTRMQLEARVQGARAAQERAVELLERAREEHRHALAALGRLQPAHGQKAVSRQDLDDAEARERMTSKEVEAARLAVQVASFELEQARASLHFRTMVSSPGEGQARFEVFSPVSGSVLRVMEESEAVVAAGAPLVELGNLSDMEVEVEVLSADAVRIRPGARVVLERWGGADPVPGRVRRIDPSGFTKVSALGVEEQRVLVIVDFVEPVEKRPLLGDAFRVEARIVTAEAEDVLKVPAGALFRREGEWSVFVVERDRAVLRPVKIGLRNDLEAQVLHGLEEGDRVISYPGDRVGDHVAVTPR
jgi:HlyD family secretion protein